jgi:hypothetical protein
VGNPSYELLAACLDAPAALGLLTAALGWYVECSSSRARVVLRYAPLAFPLAGALVVGSSLSRWAGDLALLSGPWGRTALLVVGAVGGRTPLSPVPAVLLAATATAASAVALSIAGDAPAEELWRRARLRRGLCRGLCPLVVAHHQGAGEREGEGRVAQHDARP